MQGIKKRQINAGARQHSGSFDEARAPPRGKPRKQGIGLARIDRTPVWGWPRHRGQLARLPPGDEPGALDAVGQSVGGAG